MSVSRGRLIVLEGQETAGKTTQALRLVTWLSERGVDAVLVREPGNTPAGEKIRELVLQAPEQLTAQAQALLFMASRAELVDRVIVPELWKGRIVIMDRFFLSTYAYQVGGWALDAEWVENANKLATNGLRPDVTLVLTVSLAERRARLQKRGGFDKIERAGDEFHRRVDEAFELFLSSEWQQSHHEAGQIVGVEASGSEEEVFSRILGALAEKWPETFAVSTVFHQQ